MLLCVTLTSTGQPFTEEDTGYGDTISFDEGVGTKETDKQCTSCDCHSSFALIINECFIVLAVVGFFSGRRKREVVAIEVKVSGAVCLSHARILSLCVSWFSLRHRGARAHTHAYAHA